MECMRVYSMIYHNGDNYNDRLGESKNKTFIINTLS